MKIELNKELILKVNQEELLIIHIALENLIMNAAATQTKDIAMDLANIINNFIEK